MTTRAYFFLCGFIVCVVLATGAREVAAQGEPPRSIDDILKVLEHYKPDPQAAQQVRAAAERQPPNTTDAIDLAKFYLERARAAQRIGRINQQLEDLRLAWKHGQGLSGGERGGMAAALSSAENAGGNFASALEYRKLQLNFAPGPGAQSVAQGILTSFYAQIGDLTAARDALAKAELAFQEASRTKGAGMFRDMWLSRLEAGRASVARSEGKHVEAEASWRKAVAAVEADIRVRRSEDADQSQIGTLISYLRGHANTLAALQRHGEAELVMRQALRVGLERGGRDSVTTGITVGMLADLLFQQGRGREGVALSKEALAILERAGSVPESDPVVRANRSLGRALTRQKRWQEANAHFDRMYEGIQRSPLLEQKLGVGDLMSTFTMVKLGAPEKALPILDRMLQQELGRFGPSSFQVAEVRGFRGIAYAASGQRELAFKEFRESVPVLIERIDEQAGGAGGGGRTWRQAQVLEAYIALLLDLIQRGEPPAGIDALSESFRLADVARGGRVQLALSSSAARASISDPQLADLARREQDAEQRLGALNELLTNMLSAPPGQQVPSIIAELRKEMATLRDDRARSKAEIEKRFPDYANLVHPKPPTVEQVRASLREGEALVAIFVGSDRTFVWAVPKSGAPAVAAVATGDADLTQKVAHLRKALDANATTIDDIPQFDLAAAHALYAALLKPVESAWGEAKNVLIVPHLALGQLPFALLPTAESAVAPKEALQFESYRKVPWLARRAAITQLPSVNALITLRRTPHGADTRRAYAGFGDPFFNRKQATEAIIAFADDGLGTRGVRLRSKPKVDALMSAQLALLPRLPDTRAEILDVAQVMRADLNQDVFLGEKASVQAVKGASLANRKVIHFATHGLVPGDLDGLSQPALAMTTPDLVPGSDGLLKMEDILGLKLNADWVVLSACNTASADGSGNAEAVSGLGRAFFFAGARALLVSNWPVDSPSARQLMTELFRRQAAEPSLDRAQALRQAMLELIDSGAHRDAKEQPVYSYAHPLFWAPFSLVGDGGSR